MNNRALHPEARRLLLFLAVGGVSTVFNYAVFRLCLNAFGIHYLVSSWTGYLAGVLLGFFLNAKLTFQAGKLEARHPVLYVSVYLASLALSTGLLYFLVDFAGIAPEWANVLAICQSTATNYLGCRFVVFRAGK